MTPVNFKYTRLLVFLVALSCSLLVGVSVSKSDEATHVYLFRGIFNIFSFGLDEIAEELESRGINATVLHHGSTGSARREILAGGTSRRPGTAPLVLVGHSLGANAVMALSKNLAEDDVRVKLVITLDPTLSGPLSPNVRRYINYHFSDVELSGFSGTAPEVRRRVRDINLRDYETVSGDSIGHFSMDSNENLQQEITTAIVQALR